MDTIKDTTKNINATYYAIQSNIYNKSDNTDYMYEVFYYEGPTDEKHVVCEKHFKTCQECWDDFNEFIENFKKEIPDIDIVSYSCSIM